MTQRKPTRPQQVMIGLMAVMWLSLLLWLVPEIRGVFSTDVEDTYSEWVWDLPLWAVLIVAGLHLVAGVLFVWSAGHFLEGWNNRR